MTKQDYINYFGSSLNCVKTVNISKVTITNGSVIAADPLTGLYEDMPPYTVKVPAGEFDVKACIASRKGDVRIAAVTVEFTDKEPVSFKMGLNGTEDPEELASLGENEFFGFPVDAGLCTILDTETLKAYSAFENKWYEENPDKNIYDDLLSGLFEQSYANFPDTQREGGDYIDFVIPDTDYHIPMFATGFGDGYYPVFFGFSGDNEVCAMVILFISPDAMAELEE